MKYSYFVNLLLLSFLFSGCAVFTKSESIQGVYLIQTEHSQYILKLNPNGTIKELGMVLSEIEKDDDGNYSILNNNIHPQQRDDKELKLRVKDHNQSKFTWNHFTFNNFHIEDEKSGVKHFEVIKIKEKDGRIVFPADSFSALMERLKLFLMLYKSDDWSQLYHMFYNLGMDKEKFLKSIGSDDMPIFIDFDPLSIIGPSIDNGNIEWGIYGNAKIKRKEEVLKIEGYIIFVKQINGKWFFNRKFHIDRSCCPWVYVYDGSAYKRRLEIIRNLNSEMLEGTEKSRLGKVHVADGLILIQIREEEDEISYIDLINLEINGVIIKPDIDSEAAGKIKDSDGDYLIMNKNDSYSFVFDVSAVEKHISESDINIIAKGYYIRTDTISDN